MSNINPIQHQNNCQQSLDLTSEGATLLIENLIQSGYLVRIKVSGRSMRPFLMGDEIVTIRKLPPQVLKRGDIVLFVNDEGKPLLHRVVRIRRDQDNNIRVQTKGDGQIELDTPVDASRILGYVSRIEVMKSTSEGKSDCICKDLTLFRHRLIASAVARRELVRYYLYRLLARSPFILKSKEL